VGQVFDGGRLGNVKGVSTRNGIAQKRAGFVQPSGVDVSQCELRAMFRQINRKGAADS
jgi:hypothetical protein